MTKPRLFWIKIESEDNLVERQTTLKEIGALLTESIETEVPFKFEIKHSFSLFASGDQNDVYFEEGDFRFHKENLPLSEFVKWIDSDGTPFLSEPTTRYRWLLERVRKLFDDLHPDLTKPEMVAYWSAIEMCLGFMEIEMENNPFATSATVGTAYYREKLGYFRHSLAVLIGISDGEIRSWKNNHLNADGRLYSLEASLR